MATQKKPGIGRSFIPDWWVVAASVEYHSIYEPLIRANPRGWWTEYEPEGSLPIGYWRHGYPVVNTATILHGWSGQPVKVCLAAIKRASERGYVTTKRSDTSPTQRGRGLVECRTFVPGENSVAFWNDQFRKASITS